MSIWKILGIEATSKINEIKKAYAKRAKIFNPEEKPQEFKILHTAYKEAIAYAKNVQKYKNIIDSPNKEQNPVFNLEKNEDQINESKEDNFNFETICNKNNNNEKAKENIKEEIFNFKGISSNLELSVNKETNRIDAQDLELEKNTTIDSLLRGFSKLIVYEFTNEKMVFWDNYFNSNEFNRFKYDEIYLKKINKILKDSDINSILLSYLIKKFKTSNKSKYISNEYNELINTLKAHKVELNNIKKQIFLKKSKSIIKSYSFILGILLLFLIMKFISNDGSESNNNQPDFSSLPYTSYPNETTSKDTSMNEDDKKFYETFFVGKWHSEEDGTFIFNSDNTYCYYKNKHFQNTNFSKGTVEITSYGELNSIGIISFYITESSWEENAKPEIFNNSYLLPYIILDDGTLTITTLSNKTSYSFTKTKK